MAKSEKNLAASPCQLIDLWRDQNLQKIVDDNLECLRRLERQAIELRFAHHAMDQDKMCAMVEEIYSIAERISLPKVFDQAYRLFLFCKQKPEVFPEEIWSDLFEALNEAKSQFVRNILESFRPAVPAA